MTGSVARLWGTVRFVCPRRVTFCAAVALSGQASAPTFDVVSIKRAIPPHKEVVPARCLMAHGDHQSALRTIFVRGVSEPVRDIEKSRCGMDFYDVTVKPPSGADRSLIRRCGGQCWRIAEFKGI